LFFLESKDHITLPYKAGGKIVVLCVLISSDLKAHRMVIVSELKGKKHLPNLYFSFCHEPHISLLLSDIADFSFMTCL